MWILPQLLFVVAVGYVLFLLAKKRLRPIPREEAHLPRRKHLLIAAAVIVPLVPIVIFGHEMAHWLVGKAWGWDVTLHHDHVLYQRPAEEVPKSELFLFTIAGPLVEFILAVIGCWGLWSFRRDKLAHDEPIRFWIFTAMALLGLRWLRFRFTSESDETTISELMGMPPWFVPALLFLPALFVTKLIVSTHRRNRTLLPLLAGVGIAAAVAILYLVVLGPAMFPPPSTE